MSWQNVSHFELEYWSDGTYVPEGWYPYKKNKLEPKVFGSLQEAESFALSLRGNKRNDNSYRVVEVVRRAVSYISSLSLAGKQQMLDLTIFLANMQFAKDLLDRADLLWHEHNRVVEVLFRSASQFFEDDWDRLCYNWNQFGFYWYLSDLGETMPAHLFTKAELDFSKEAANQWLQLFEPIDPPQ